MNKKENKYKKKEKLPYMEILANNLRYLIGEETVISTARKIGISQQTLHRYLHCEREISLVNLIKLADYFGEDLDYLTGRKT